MVHALKIDPKYFQMIVNGEKPYEIRKKDRPFRVGDYVALNEYKDGCYTGYFTFAKITKIFENDEYIKSGYVALTLMSVNIQISSELSLYGNGIKRKDETEVAQAK